MARLLKLHQFADKHHFCVDLSQKGRNGVTRTSQQPQLSTLRQDVAVAATKHAARTQRAKTAYRKDAACRGQQKVFNLRFKKIEKRLCLQSATFCHVK